MSFAICTSQLVKRLNLTVMWPQYMSYLDDMGISRRPYVALAVLGAREVTYSVAAVTVVDDYLVNVPLRGLLVDLDDFDTWQVMHHKASHANMCCWFIHSSNLSPAGYIQPTTCKPVIEALACSSLKMVNLHQLALVETQTGRT